MTPEDTSRPDIDDNCDERTADTFNICLNDHIQRGGEAVRLLSCVRVQQ